ncbi:MAG: hypothetical protein DME22_05600 [Verrucomicrobia bacterium]|nr:MAG: hypothetical protein DME22_05600 [Verrucomicrobiota bacterium]
MHQSIYQRDEKTDRRCCDSEVGLAGKEEQDQITIPREDRQSMMPPKENRNTQDKQTETDEDQAERIERCGDQVTQENRYRDAKAVDQQRSGHGNYVRHLA